MALDTNRLIARLVNWARWASADAGAHGHCASAEHRYQAPWPDDERLRITARVPVDQGDAQTVEGAVCTLRCDRDRTFLVWVYIERRSRSEICRRMRLPLDLFEAFHHRVLGALAYRVEVVESASCRGHLHPLRGARINRSHNLIPPAASG